MAWVGSPAQSQISLFLEYPFPQISGVMSLEKHGRTSHARHRFIWLVKIGGPLVCFARKVHLKINKSFVTVLEQGRKVVDFYLIHSWFLDVKWGSLKHRWITYAPFIEGKQSHENIILSCIIIRTMTMKGEQTNFNWEYTHSGTDNFSRVAQPFLSLYVITKEPHSSYKEMMIEYSQYNLAVSTV